MSESVPATARETHTHPACQLYQELTGKAPNKQQVRLIAEKVTDLSRWREKIEKWLASGYRADNVPGMLDWYAGKGQERINGRTPGPSPPEQRPPLPAAIHQPPADALPRAEITRRLKALKDQNP